MHIIVRMSTRERTVKRIGFLTYLLDPPKMLPAGLGRELRGAGVRRSRSREHDVLQALFGLREQAVRNRHGCVVEAGCPPKGTPNRHRPRARE